MFFACAAETHEQERGDLYLKLDGGLAKYGALVVENDICLGSLDTVVSDGDFVRFEITGLDKGVDVLSEVDFCVLIVTDVDTGDGLFVLLTDMLDG